MDERPVELQDLKGAVRRQPHVQDYAFPSQVQLF